MGPGGLRGLQILRSGVQSVRGGFDSHAFPPIGSATAIVALLGLLLAGGAAPARAASPPSPEPDSTAVEEPDSTSVEEPAEAVADSATVEPATPHARHVGEPEEAPYEASTSRWEQPKYVMFRSLLVPGWGQFHNHAWWKGAAIATGEVYLAVRLVQDSKELDNLKQQALETTDDNESLALIDQHNALLDKYVSRQWMFGLLMTYSLLDAYIDAHFRHFKAEFGPDKALPKGGGADHSVRFSFGWSF